MLPLKVWGRHSWEQLLQQSPHPNMHPLHSAIRSNSDLSPNIFMSVAITWLCCANNTPGDRHSPGNSQFLCLPHGWAPACARTLLPSLRPPLYFSSRSSCIRHFSRTPVKNLQPFQAADFYCAAVSHRLTPSFDLAAVPAISCPSDPA